MLPLDKQYKDFLINLKSTGFEEFNERTGHKTLALPGVTFQFDLEESFPILTLRKIPLKIFIAEQIWFLMGSRTPNEFLSKYTKIWDDFTTINGTVTTAYGYRIRHHFGRDQMDLLVKLLHKEPGSRQGVVVFWDPADDGLYSSRKKKNIPCPFTFIVNVMGGKLNFHLVVRSNDMILGFPHDLGGFSLLAYILAAKLEVKPGIFTHSISHAHIYDIHYSAIDEMINRNNNHKPIKFIAEKNYYSRAEKGDSKLVEEILSKLESQYQPMEPIKGLQIVL